MRCFNPGKGVLVLKRILTNSLLERRRQWGLALLIGLQCVLGFHFWNAKPAPIIYGVLVKSPDHYLIAWRTAGSLLDSHEEPDLESAVRFAHSLNLVRVVLPHSPVKLERLTIQPRAGHFVLQWKVSTTPFLNQITFRAEEEANYFADAFRQGAYATSPFGHSILLMPAVGNFESDFLAPFSL